MTVPSGSSKAATREEDELAVYCEGGRTQLGFWVTRRDA
jgi:hypothetical protein